MSEPTEPTKPVVEVVSGSPTEEELAAIITVLSAASSADGRSRTTDLPRAGGWKSYWRVVRREHRPGPAAWRHAIRRG
ncbi:hypothetical protein GCM10027418_21910 [Mariniluteicoccus endophyticus]